MNFDNVKSISINGKKVKSIEIDGNPVYGFEEEELEEIVEVPVTITWNDNDNADGNRPNSVGVLLFSDGVYLDFEELSSANGWTHTFSDLPKYDNSGNEITYTITTEPVEWYLTEVYGYNLVMEYQPEVITVSVQKVWEDNNNAIGNRPSSVARELSNGDIYVLNEANGWSATVENLPIRKNGELVTYAWRESDVVGYTLSNVHHDGNLMIFTNMPRPSDDQPRPNRPGDTWYIYEEYDTPL